MCKIKSHLTVGNLAKLAFEVNFIIQKLKSKHLHSLSQSSLLTGFLREREKIFYTYSEPGAI